MFDVTDTSVLAVDQPFLCGVVEGFYGRAWSWEERRGYAKFLTDHGLNCYVYAPKSDAWLRKAWRDSWPDDEWFELQATADHYRISGLQFGVGLSPYNLYREYDANGRRHLLRKLDRLAELQPAVIAVLFDDMPGDFAQLAAAQAEIVSDVVDHSPMSRILVCPTYYSFDPVLEKVFGAMPENYWHELGNALPTSADILWTGNKVCSDSVGIDDIRSISVQLGRPVVLWDNYPVNDSARGSRFLHLDALTLRDPELVNVLRGHLSNPMNQAALSRFPLSSLSALYSGNYDSEQARAAAFYSLADGGLAALLERDWQLFQSGGLDSISAERCSSLKQEYFAIDDPAAQEVGRWLDGYYTFDPACLTG